MPKLEMVSFLDFKFDPSSGDLLRGGKRLRIPKQTSRLLAIFLENSGTVVTRAKLQELLWPEGEFLDHEHAINRVITDLRAVLRDDPRNPRYIETVHKRGYRFLPKIVTIPFADPPVTPETQSVKPPPSAAISIPEAPQTIAPTPPERLHLEQPRPESPRQQNWIILGASVLMLLLIAAGYVLYARRHRPPVVENNVVSLGIAPFLAEGPGAEEPAESFRLDLADALAQLPIVQIRAMNSLNNINRDDNGIRDISEKLHLDMLLLGTFRLQGDQCTMQFELVRGRDSLHIASYQYKGGKDELAVIRDKIQRDMFLSLQGKGKSLQSIRGSTNDAQAYGEYLQGRELTQLRDPAALDQALTHYQNAIQRDPKFAEAYAGMAATHLALRFSNVADHQNAAKQLAQQALELDPTLAEAHAVLGDIAFRSDWDFARGESELRRAIELDPHKSLYHGWLASLLVDQGRFDEAMTEVDRTIADDPLWPTAYSMATFVAGMAHDNVRTMAFVQKYVSLVPDSSYSHNQLAWAYFSAKRYDEALNEWARMAELDKDLDRIKLEAHGREAFDRGGIMPYALLRLEAIEHHAPETARHGNDFDPAEWYAFTGQTNKALEALQRIVAERDSDSILIAVNPMLDNLHTDARFQALVHQVGLTLPNYPHHNGR